MINNETRIDIEMIIRNEYKIFLGMICSSVRYSAFMIKTNLPGHIGGLGRFVAGQGLNISPGQVGRFNNLSFHWFVLFDFQGTHHNIQLG
jgi:hypothetical protein